LSDESGNSEKDGGGFTAWGEDGLFNGLGAVSVKRVKREHVADAEPDLRGESWLSAIEEKAREEGFRAGFSQGLDEANKEMEPLRKSLLAWSEGLPGSLEKTLVGHLDSMVDIVLESVTRLVGETLSTPSGIRNIVEMAIGKRTPDLSGVLAVSPEMEQRLRTLAPDLREALSLRNILVESDAGLGLSEFSFRTEFHSSSVDPLEGIRELERMLREGLKK
jgi:hypothetical protein